MEIQAQKNIPSFQGYRQRFSDEEFQKALYNSVSWAKENTNFSKYLLPQKHIEKRLENNAKKGLKILNKFRTLLKKPEIEPIVEMSIKEHELLGKVIYYNSEPIEIKTQLPNNLKSFFKKICTVAKAKMEEDVLKEELWKILEKEKYIEACQKKRFKEFTNNGKNEPNPLLFYYDITYSELSKKLANIANEKNTYLEKLKTVKTKLKNHTFKLK